MAPSADPTQDNSTVTSATESTPLLSAPEVVIKADGNGHAIKPTGLSDTADDGVSPSNDEPEERPMPYLQILTLCYVSLAEPVAYFAIFPFINEMIYRLGQRLEHPLPESSVGFWTGLIESLFSLVQMALMIFYGRAADKYGRKPILVFSTSHLHRHAGWSFESYGAGS